MTSEEERIFTKLLSKIGQNETVLRNNPLTFFCAIQGQQSNQELMVVGRSVNGWTTERTPNQLNSQSASRTLIQEMRGFSQSTDSNCPMNWVVQSEGAKPYNTRRSAFWRVMRNVSFNLFVGVNSERWSSSLIWSNLYKVSPSSGGNPSAKLIAIQLPFCIQLLRQELLQWTPKRLLFLTGWSWAAPFFQDGQIIFAQEESRKFVEAVGYIQVSGSIHRIRTVIAPHPQSKDETSITQQIIKSFS